MTYFHNLCACLCLALIFLTTAAIAGPIRIQPATAPSWNKGRETGLPIPRFVSLKAYKARMRVGPSTIYPTKWIYMKPGLPLEIIDEYGHWRQVRDDAGTTGWMHSALLSGLRTAVVGPWLKANAMLRGSPETTATLIAELQPGVLLSLRSCTGTWCSVSVQKHSASGYIRQNMLWGAYPGEMFR
ncbi:SH3 domain-containing protein [Rhizobium leucaenae]|nr:SH3 domain-containing protein [Rhizobium leucaenae]MBB6304501.1 SH3-like domain-containing protein [Rhizobium leucaenae]